MRIQTQTVAKIRRGRFLKGPIPWEWLVQASNLPGKAVIVGLTLWLRSGMQRSLTVKLPHVHLRELGVSRHATYSGVAALRTAGLVTVTQLPGRSPIVTILSSTPKE